MAQESAAARRVRALVACFIGIVLAATSAFPAAAGASGRSVAAMSAAFPAPPPQCSSYPPYSGLYTYVQSAPPCLMNYVLGDGDWAPIGPTPSTDLTITPSSSVLTIGKPITFSVGTGRPHCGPAGSPTAVKPGCWSGGASITSTRFIPTRSGVISFDGSCGNSLTCTLTPTNPFSVPLDTPNWVIIDASLGMVSGIGSPVYDLPGGPHTAGETAEIAMRLSGSGASLQPSFTVTPFGVGEYQFVSTTSAPKGDGLTSQWDYGDGTTGTGSASTHTYTKPGTYTVTLMVTGTDGDGGADTQQVTVAAPKLSVSVIFPGTTFYSAPPNPDVGATVDVQVDIGASDGVGDLSNVEFAGPPLQITPAAKLSIVDGPTPSPAPVMSLPPDSDVVFDYHLKAQKLGIATLTSSVTAADASGANVQANDHEAIQVGKNLVVAVDATPSPITMPKDAQDNPIPQPLTITVSVTNPLTVPLDVTLGKPPTVQHLQASENLDPIALDTSKPLPKLHIGVVAPQQTVKVAFAYLAINDGASALDWTATAPNPDDPTAKLSGVGHVEVDVNPTYLLDVNVAKVSGGSIVKAGEPFDVNVQIKNVTNSVVVHLDPIQPILSGNAGGGNPFDINAPPPPATLHMTQGAHVPATLCNPAPPATGSSAHLDDTYILPWSGDIGAGDPLALWGVVQTVPDGPTRASLTYHLTGTVQLKDGTTRPLTDQDIKMSPGNGTIDQSLDVTDPPAAKADFTSFTGNFGLGMIRGTCEFLASTFDSVAWVVKSGFTVVNPRTYADAALKLYQSIEYADTWYESLTPTQKDAWISEAAQIIWDQTADKTTTTYAAIKAKVNADALSFWTRLIGAWNSGDMNTVAATMGDITSNTSLQVLTFLIPEADVVSLAERNEGAQAAAAGIKDATKLEDGINLTADFPDALQTIYGLLPEQAGEVSSLAADKGVLIAVRSRNPVSNKLIQLYHAVTKPGSIAVKTVNDIDVAYLGYNAADTGLVVLYQPNHAAVVAKAATLPADVQSLVLDRLAQREAEWSDYIAKYKSYAKPLDQGGGVPVEFDWNGQGISTQPNPGAGSLRAFDLSNTGADGSARPANYFLPRIADNSGALRVITGDVDVVGITEANGRAILSAAERIDLYKSLMKIVDMQHPETLTWLTGGPKQVDLLTDHVGPAAERLAVFGPDGNAFTASINADLTTFDANNALLGVWFNGAYKSSTALAYHYADISAALIQNAGRTVTNTYLSAASWFVTAAGAPPQSGVPASGDSLAAARRVTTAGGATSGDNHGMFGDCAWQFSTDSNATVLYTNHNGGLVQWNAATATWDSYDTAPCAVSGTHPAIHLLPQTALVNGVAAGATTARVYSLSSIDAGVPASTPWFAAGQTVVIDPGESNQETATISDVSPLTFNHSLRFAHLAGAMVSVIPGGGTSPVLVVLLLLLIVVAALAALTIHARTRGGATSWRGAAVVTRRRLGGVWRMVPRRGRTKSSALE